MIIEPIASILDEIARNPQLWLNAGQRYETKGRIANALLKAGFTSEEIHGRADWDTDEESGKSTLRHITNIKNNTKWTNV